MAFIIWRISDGKAGHDSQSIGLCSAIEKLKPCRYIDVTADSLINNIKNIFLRQFPFGKDLPAPNIIVGAGHGTHLTMLSAKHAYKGKTIVLMKPSLPLSFFDICIIPKHDAPPIVDNVISTNGALTPIQFNENKLANTGLILLGGPSKHYVWDEDSITMQIKKIVTNHSNIHWTIADSPRTPKSTMNRLHSLANNIDILNFTETDSATVRKLIFNADNVWVSADSISMIYESLSSGAMVGLLNVKPKKSSRLISAVKTLINEKQLSTFEQWNNTRKLFRPTIKFNEAERCVSLLNKRGLLD